MWMTAVLCSCSLQEELIAPGPECEIEGLVTVELHPATQSPGVKSMYIVDDSVISDINILAYRDGLLCGQLYSAYDGGALGMTLVLGHEYNIYALANTGAAFDAPPQESGLGSCSISVDYDAIGSAGIPMSGSETFCPVRAGDSVALPMKRLFAKLVFDAERSPGGGAEFAFTAVAVRQAAARIFPFAKKSRALSTSDVSDGDCLDAADISAVNAGEAAVFYIPENMQGTLLEDNDDPWKKIPSKIGSDSNLCTYLEVRSDFSGYSETGSVTFRFYLGGDNCTNFDIQRNTSYHVTLLPGEDPGSISSWKVNADLETNTELSFVKTDASGDDYVGYEQTFRILGLQSGETVSSVTVNGATEVTHPVLSGTQVSYVPYYTWQLLKVTTSMGRVYQGVVTATMPALASSQYLDLPADGTSVKPCIRYADPVTGAILSGFDSAFYENYLKAKTLTLANIYTGLVAGNDYVKLTSGTFTQNSSVDGSSSGSEGTLFAYKVNVGGWSYGTDVGTVTVKSPRFSSMATATITLRISFPMSGFSETCFGQVNDWSMIPATGDMDLSYLAAQGFSAVDSINASWSCSGVSYTVDKSNVYGPQISSGTISDVVSSGDNYSFKITSSHSYSKPGVYFRIKNTKADVYSINNVQIGYVDGCLHLAVGVIRTAITSNGAYSSKWKAAGAFAKPSGGLSGFASVVESAFKSGGSYQKCVYVKGAGPIVSYPQGAGGVKVTINTESSVYGVNADLYSVTYDNISGYLYYPQSHYDSQVPFIALYTYRSDSCLGDLADGPVEYAGTGVYVHNYRDLYPDSGGWLTPAISNYQIFY